jgi:hypothetical protein
VPSSMVSVISILEGSRLHAAQPSLRQIRDLEHGVAAPPLVRSAQGVGLTDSGPAFLDHARLSLARIRLPSPVGVASGLTATEACSRCDRFKRPLSAHRAVAAISVGAPQYQASRLRYRVRIPRGPISHAAGQPGV